jgi:transcriptional regulator with XRE-family HTH domain
MLSESDFDTFDTIRRYREVIRTGRYLELRKIFGLSQAQVAEAIGVGKPSISHYESGRRIPTGETALRYGRFMDELERRLAGTDS